MRISTHLVELQMSCIPILNWRYGLSGISNIIYSHTTYDYIPNIFFYTTYLSHYYHLSKDHIVTLILLFVSHDSHRLDAPILPKPHRITRGFALIRLLTVPHLNIIKWMSDWFMTKWNRRIQSPTWNRLYASASAGLDATHRRWAFTSWYERK